VREWIGTCYFAIDITVTVFMMFVLLYISCHFGKHRLNIPYDFVAFYCIHNKRVNGDLQTLLVFLTFQIST